MRPARLRAVQAGQYLGVPDRKRQPAKLVVRLKGSSDRIDVPNLAAEIIEGLERADEVILDLGGMRFRLWKAEDD